MFQLSCFFSSLKASVVAVDYFSPPLQAGHTTPSWSVYIPEGPDTKLLRTSTPKAIIIMVFKPEFHNNKVPGPSGHALWAPTFEFT